MLKPTILRKSRTHCPDLIFDYDGHLTTCCRKLSGLLHLLEFSQDDKKCLMYHET